MPGDNFTRQFPLMEQAQKLLKTQQPVVLKDPFPQGQNSASASKVAGGTPNVPDPNYINMVWSQTLLDQEQKLWKRDLGEG